MSLSVLRSWLAALACLVSMSVSALTNEQALAVSVGEGDARLASLAPLIASADAQLPAFLSALLEGNVRTADGKVFLLKGDAASDIAGVAVKLPENAEEVVNNNCLPDTIVTQFDLVTPFWIGASTLLLEQILCAVQSMKLALIS